MLQAVVYKCKDHARQKMSFQHLLGKGRKIELHAVKKWMRFDMDKDSWTSSYRNQCNLKVATTTGILGYVSKDNDFFNFLKKPVDSIKTGTTGCCF